MKIFWFDLYFFLLDQIAFLSCYMVMLQCAPHMLQCTPPRACCHISLPFFQGKSRKKYIIVLIKQNHIIVLDMW